MLLPAPEDRPGDDATVGNADPIIVRTWALVAVCRPGRKRCAVASDGTAMAAQLPLHSLQVEQSNDCESYQHSSLSSITCP
jgi:hypothetical protein